MTSPLPWSGHTQDDDPDSTWTQDADELDLIDKFGPYPMDVLDKFVLQTHLNALAERYCQDRVNRRGRT